MERLLEARLRLKAVQAEIGRIDEADFPNLAGRIALKEISQVFKEDEMNLSSLDESQSASDVIQTTIATALFNIETYLPLIGFILRSTNIRNAFELHGPLTRLARKVLGKKTNLVISSEWTYSPLILIEPPSLPGFSMIGFPAHESGNPLIAPLAGHELGHALWNHDKEQLWRFGFEEEISDSVFKELWKKRAELHRADSAIPVSDTPEEFADDLVVAEKATAAIRWATNQAEEYFCDFVGIRLFGLAFLNAFSFLVAPRLAGQRSHDYPDLVQRVKAQTAAARAFGVLAPPDYVVRFQPMDQVENPGSTHGIMILAADSAAEALCAKLVAHINTLFPSSQKADLWLPVWSTVSGSGVTPDPDIEKRIAEIAQSFHEKAPPLAGGSLALLLNGAWAWLDVARGAAKRDGDTKFDVLRALDGLREVVLKSVEVLEYEERLRSAGIDYVT